MLYEFKLRSNATAAARKICQAFDTDVVNERAVLRWYRKFQEGDESLENGPRSGRPTAMVNEALLAAVEADNGQTYEKVAQQFKVSAETIRLHLHHLGKTHKLSRWVPHELTVAHKAALADACLSLLSRQRKDPFLDRLLTSDEKWVLYDTPRRRHHWFAPHEPVPKQPKPPLHPKKIMLCVWWTARGIANCCQLDKQSVPLYALKAGTCPRKTEN
jgi:histone-lysine N-methyltransferase SETMAR